MKVYCPECDAPVRVPSDHPAGKKVRCPECDLAFRPPESAPTRSRRSRDDDYDRPRRKGKKQSSNTAALVAIPIVLIVLLGVGGAVAYFGFIKKDEDPGAAYHGPPPGDSGPPPPKSGPPAPPKMGPGGAAGGVPKVAANGRVGVQVGNTAQEIEGDDIDGKEFKLSDYRGKVVLLDFWGHW
jgi:predicted Zn finger-like uncharacterized protein